MPKTNRLAATAALCLLLALATALVADQYGESMRLDEVTPIADILADPDTYIGTHVRVEGQVLDVCPRRGCWIDVGSDEASIRIKVEDDVIVFPATAKGKVAAAEGVVEAVDMTREEYVGWLTHLAEERGETFDAAQADIGSGPYRLVRIRGAGASIE